MWLALLLPLLLVNELHGFNPSNAGNVFNLWDSDLSRLLDDSYRSLGVNIFGESKHLGNQSSRVRRSISGMLGMYTQIISFNRQLGSKVSKPCHDALYNMVTSIGEIFKGKFPSSLIYMIDASGKYTSGSIRGATLRKGSFHQCIQVKDDKNGFAGKYCQIRAEYGPPNSSDTLDYAEYQIYPTTDRNLFEIGICLPSLCAPKDAGEVVKLVADMRYGVQLDVNKVKCHESSERPLSSSAILAIVLCLMLSLVLLLGTAYDIWLSFQPNNGETQPNHPIFQKSGRQIGQILLCFSIRKNMGFILNHQENGGVVVPSLNGVRSLTLFWVIFTNIYIVAKDRPWVNYTGLLEDLRTLPLQIVLNGRFAADTSFCIGGFLAAYLTLKKLEGKGKLGILNYYLHRALRLLPSYLMVMVLTSGIYYYSNDGPDWMSSNEYETACNQHWWKGLIFMNNFFNGSETCPSISWYLATDVQLHFMAPFIIYPLYTMPHLGIILLLIVLAIFSAVPAITATSEQLPYFTGRLFYLEPGHNEYISDILMKPWTHAAPFIIGIFYGFLLYKSGPQISMKLKTVIFGWLIAVTAVLVILFGFYPYIDGTRKMTVIMGIIYTTMTPSIWAAAIGWILYSCATGYGGVVNSMLNWGVFDVFSRVSYCGYLLNFLAISHFLNSRVDSFYYDTCTIIMIFVGVLFTTTVSAIILSTTVERPFSELVRMLRSKDINPSTNTIDDKFTINVHNRRIEGSTLQQNLSDYNDRLASGTNKAFGLITNAQKWFGRHQPSDKQPLISNQNDE